MTSWWKASAKEGLLKKYLKVAVHVGHFAKELLQPLTQSQFTPSQANSTPQRALIAHPPQKQHVRSPEPGTPVKTCKHLIVLYGFCPKWYPSLGSLAVNPKEPKALKAHPRTSRLFWAVGAIRRKTPCSHISGPWQIDSESLPVSRKSYIPPECCRLFHAIDAAVSQKSGKPCT